MTSRVSSVSLMQFRRFDRFSVTIWRTREGESNMPYVYHNPSNSSIWRLNKALHSDNWRIEFVGFDSFGISADFYRETLTSTP